MEDSNGTWGPGGGGGESAGALAAMMGMKNGMQEKGGSYGKWSYGQDPFDNEETIRKIQMLPSTKKAKVKDALEKRMQSHSDKLDGLMKLASRWNSVKTWGPHDRNVTDFMDQYRHLTGSTASNTDLYYQFLNMSINNKTNPAKVAANAEQNIIDGLALQASNLESENTEVESEFAVDFWKWLNGKGTEEDHKKTPWGRTPLRFDDVVAYCDGFLDMRFDFLKKVINLESRGPSNLDESYVYFKYLVRGTPEDRQGLGFLQDWDKMMDRQNETNPKLAGMWHSEWMSEQKRSEILYNVGKTNEVQLKVSETLSLINNFLNPPPPLPEPEQVPELEPGEDNVLDPSGPDLEVDELAEKMGKLTTETGEPEPPLPGSDINMLHAGPVPAPLTPAEEIQKEIKELKEEYEKQKQKIKREEKLKEQKERNKKEEDGDDVIINPFGSGGKNKPADEQQSQKGNSPKKEKGKKDSHEIQMLKNRHEVNLKRLEHKLNDIKLAEAEKVNADAMKLAVDLETRVLKMTDDHAKLKEFSYKIHGHEKELKKQETRMKENLEEVIGHDKLPDVQKTETYKTFHRDYKELMRRIKKNEKKLENDPLKDEDRIAKKEKLEEELRQMRLQGREGKLKMAALLEIEIESAKKDRKAMEDSTLAMRQRMEKENTNINIATKDARWVEKTSAALQVEKQLMEKVQSQSKVYLEDLQKWNQMYESSYEQMRENDRKRTQEEAMLKSREENEIRSKNMIQSLTVPKGEGPNMVTDIMEREVQREQEVIKQEAHMEDSNLAKDDENQTKSKEKSNKINQTTNQSEPQKNELTEEEFDKQGEELFEKNKQEALEDISNQMEPIQKRMDEISRIIQDSKNGKMDTDQTDQEIEKLTEEQLILQKRMEDLKKSRALHDRKITDVHKDQKDLEIVAKEQPMKERAAADAEDKEKREKEEQEEAELQKSQEREKRLLELKQEFPTYTEEQVINKLNKETEEREKEERERPEREKKAREEKEKQEKAERKKAKELKKQKDAEEREEKEKQRKKKAEEAIKENAKLKAEQEKLRGELAEERQKREREKQIEKEQIDKQKKEIQEQIAKEQKEKKERKQKEKEEKAKKRAEKQREKEEKEEKEKESKKQVEIKGKEEEKEKDDLPKKEILEKEILEKEEQEQEPVLPEMETSSEKERTSVKRNEKEEISEGEILPKKPKLDHKKGEEQRNALERAILTATVTNQRIAQKNQGFEFKSEHHPKTTTEHKSQEFKFNLQKLNPGIEQQSRSINKNNKNKINKTKNK